MGQYWEMVAYERRETMGCWGKAGEFMQTASPALVIHRLAVPVQDEHARDARRGPAPCNQSPQEHSRLLQLSVDVILLITDELDLNSLYSFSHCCWTLHSLLRTVVNSRFRRSLAPWANTPLICAGDYMETNPPGVTTRVPKDFAPDPDMNEDIPPERYSDLTVYDVVRHMHPTDVLYGSACLSLPTYPRPKPRRPYYQFTNMYHEEPWERILEIRKYFPPGRRWVLRNLTTKEYVYAHVFTSLDGKGGGQDRPDATSLWGYSLGTLVFVNTCWSDDDSAAMFGLNVRGRWAAHCFDIVEEAKLLKDMKDSDGVWVDVSFREYQAMVQLFKQNRWDRA